MLSLQPSADRELSPPAASSHASVSSPESPLPVALTAADSSSTKAKDWFEFILDLSLLDRHLSEKQLEPSGSTLIVQFLYHANMTEQIYNNSALVKNSTTPSAAVGSSTPTPTSGAAEAPNASPTNQASANPTPAPPINVAINSAVELKIKRIRLLRTLSVKTAALLDWDLIKFENEIPIAVISDLLHIFVRLAMNDSESTGHGDYNLDELNGQSVFALQLLNRWCLRAVLFSKFPKRPATKTVQPNVPGVFNAIPNMKDANESVLKAIITTAQDSIDFLEKCLQKLNRDICVPTNACFVRTKSVSPSGESAQETYEIEWSNAQTLKLEELKCYVSYDLGMYYFQAENYERSLSLFEDVKACCNKLSESGASSSVILDQIKTYTSELDNYLYAVRNMLSTITDEEVLAYTQQSVDKNFRDESSRSLLKKHVLIDQIERTGVNASNIEQLKTCLLEDNKLMQIPINTRSHIESSLIAAQQRHHLNSFTSTASMNDELNLLKEAIEAVSCLNQIRQIVSENFFVRRTQNSTFLSSSQLYQKSLPKKGQDALESYRELKLKRERAIERLMKASTNYIGTQFLNAGAKGQSGPLIIGKLSLQTCDPVELKNLIDLYKMTNPEQTLKSFWFKWPKNVLRLFQLSEGSIDEASFSNEKFLANFFQLANTNDINYYFICLAKLSELIETKKYENAHSIIKVFESWLLSSNSTNSLMLKLITNQKLYLDLLRSTTNRVSWTNLNEKDQEQLIQNAKDFVRNSRNDSETSIDILREAFAFLLSTGEYNFLANIASPADTKKHQTTFNQGYYELFKFIAKVAQEIDKSDKNSLRKLSRDLWDKLVEIFTESNAPTGSSGGGKHSGKGDDSMSMPYDAASALLFPKSKPSQKSGGHKEPTAAHLSVLISRESFKKILVSILAKASCVGLVGSGVASNSGASPKFAASSSSRVKIVNIFVSLICTLYNIIESSANSEIHSEYRSLWPSSLANSNRIDLNSLVDLMKTMLSQSLTTIDPYNSSWLRTQADLYMAQAQFSDAIKYYIKLYMCETGYFFSRTATNSDCGKIFSDEKLTKLLIRSAIQINKHTQAALLSQLLNTNSLNPQQQLNTNPNKSSFDYSVAFRCLQDKQYLTMDDLDSLYDSIWDLSLLEYLTFLNAQNCYVNRRNICLKLFSTNYISSSNPLEMNLKTQNSKRSHLFLKLVKYYFFV